MMHYPGTTAAYIYIYTRDRINTRYTSVFKRAAYIANNNNIYGVYIHVYWEQTRTDTRHYYRDRKHQRKSCRVFASRCFFFFYYFYFVTIRWKITDSRQRLEVRYISLLWWGGGGGGGDSNGAVAAIGIIWLTV